MPGRDRTGPAGEGMLSGRGMGPCAGTGYDFGPGLGYGFGLGCRRGFRRFGNRFGGFGGFGRFGGSGGFWTGTEKDRKEFLKEQRDFYKNRVDEIDKELENK